MVPNIANVCPHGSRVKNVNRKTAKTLIDFIKFCFKFFQDCYCVIKKWKIMNSNLTHSLQKFPSEAWFWATTGNFHIRWENNMRNSLYNWNTRRLNNQNWIATLVYFLKLVSWHIQVNDYCWNVSKITVGKLTGLVPVIDLSYEVPRSNMKAQMLEA